MTPTPGTVQPHCMNALRIALAAATLIPGMAYGQPTTKPEAVPARAAQPNGPSPESRTVGDDIALAVANQFSKDYSGGGMRRVSANSEACYTSLKGATGDARTAAYRCILYDIVAYRLDTGMRERFRSQGWNPGPASPYLSDEAFQARRLQTAKAYFQSSLETQRHYFSDRAVDFVLIRAETALADRLKKMKPAT